MYGPAVASAVIAAVLLSVAAAGVVAICWISANGILGPNPMAGLRTKALLQSERTWQVGHQAAIRPMAIGAVVAVVAAIGSVFATRDLTTYLIMLGVSVAAIVAGLIVATVVAGRAARRLR